MRSLNHLSIDEVGIPSQYHLRLKILKIIYIIFLCLTILSVLLSSYTRLERQNYPEFIYAAVSFLGLITSFAYILYPKYDFSKTVFTRVIIALYVLISIGVFLGTIFWLVGASIIGAGNNWEHEDYSKYLLDLGIILIIFTSPFIIALTILITYFLRRQIAHVLNNTLEESSEEALIDSDEENATSSPGENNHNHVQEDLPLKNSEVKDLSSVESIDKCTAANSLISVEEP